ncbi:MAG: PEP-CTERM sorting domain-containing protein [Armatimonadetes bacterium]|nr:PEP-CTERM sorting domain-containing protein [Armatimonadota bacterium]
MVYRAPLGVLCSLAAACALGQLSASPYYSTLSGFNDTSNMFMSQTAYDGWISHSGADPDTFINAMAITGGTTWDPDIDFFTPSGLFSYYDPGVGYGTYTFGTAISGDTNWYVGGLASRWGDVYNVDPGVYDFTLDIIGGADANATDLLASIQYVFEVAARLDVSATGEATPGVIHYGEVTQVAMTVQNHMPNRSFFSTTWFFSGGGMSQGTDSLTHVGWEGDWWEEEIVAGGSRTDGHTAWKAAGAIPTGTYQGYMGVVGGLYLGDWHWVSMTGTVPTVELVPEPSGLLVLALGGLALIRRRRV